MTTYQALLQSLTDAVISGDTALAEGLFRGREGFPASAQAAVYTEAYVLRLGEAIEAAYPALFHYAAAQMRACTASFIREHPSRQFNLDAYALEFADYVQTHSPDPVARELARLEHAVGWVYAAPESPALDLRWLSEQSEESLAASAFRPRTAARCLRFDHDVNDYASALREGLNPSAPQNNLNSLLVYRHLHRVERLTLSEGEYVLLTLLDGKTPLASALEEERFLPYSDEALVQGRLKDWCMRWIRKGCLQPPCETR